jgi:AraC-like DNA-binding protein
MLEIHTGKNTDCCHQDKTDNPVIKVLNHQKGEENSFETSTYVLLIVLKGSGKISYRRFIDKTVTNRDILLLPAHTQVRFRIEENASILVFQLQSVFHFCDHFSLNSLIEQRDKSRRERFFTLNINQRMASYLKSLLPCLADGIQCHYFLELKMKELLFILRTYYTDEDIAVFFSPMLTDDVDFYTFVLENYKSVKTTPEFAEKAHYSHSGFIKRFRRVFGVSFHEWRRKQLSDKLLQEITCTKKSFVEIGNMYGFYSSAHLSNFCTTFFGIPPKELRKRGILGIKKNETESDE